MLKIKDTYISLKHIRCIKYEEKTRAFDGMASHSYYLVIIYDNLQTINIPVKHSGEYDELAKLIVEKVSDDDDENL